MISELTSPHSRKPYRDIVEDILEQITKGVAKEKHVYEAAKVKYALEFKPVRRIVRVEGIRDGERHLFENAVDYVLSSDGMLDWIGTNKPDEKSEFKVSYVFSDPSNITDVNTGSVVRTIVEAISRELDFVYAQMDQVYKSGFVDTATGNALDLVASILGIQRKTPTRSTGYVTFWRNADPPEIAVSGEPILYDGRDSYPLKEGPVKKINAVKGIVQGKNYTFKQGIDFLLEGSNVAVNSSLRWLNGGTKPDDRTPFSVDYSVYQKITIPLGAKVSTSAKQHENARLFETLKEATLQKSISGRWEAEVQVRALDPGEQGNVIAGGITIMPKPIIGVNNVLNTANLGGGAEQESDESLRNRTRNALEVAGKATVKSLRIALEGVEGIRSAPRIHEMPDGIPGIIKVVVDGGDETDIKNIIEETRAAGIKVEFSRPKMVTLDFAITVVVQSLGEDLEKLQSNIQTKIKDFTSSLKIEEDLVFNKLLSLVLATEGVHDVKEMLIQVYREGSKLTTSSKENIYIDEDEKASPRTVEVKIEEAKRS